MLFHISVLDVLTDEHSPVPKVVQPLKPSVVTKLLSAVEKGKNTRLSIQASGSMPFAPTKVSEECTQHLRSLNSQLHTLLSKFRQGGGGHTLVANLGTCIPSKHCIYTRLLRYPLTL